MNCISWIVEELRYICYPNVQSDMRDENRAFSKNVRMISYVSTVENPIGDSDTLKYRKSLEEKSEANKFVTTDEWTYEVGDFAMAGQKQDSSEDTMEISRSCSTIPEEKEMVEWGLNKEIVVKEDGTCTLRTIAETYV